MTTLETLLLDPDMAGVWNLVPNRSAITFKIRNMWGLLNVKGRFTEFSGDGQLTAKGAVFGRVDIRTASLRTGIGRRDRHLRSPDFFDVDRHPQVCFRSTAIGPGSDGRVRVDGELTAAGNRVALELDPTVERTDDQLHVDVRATIDQRQLGITWSPLGMTRSPVTVSSAW